MAIFFTIRKPDIKNVRFRMVGFRIPTVFSPWRNALIVAAVAVFVNHDLETDGEVPHEEDAERKEENRDDDVNPQSIVSPLKVRDGRVSELDFGALKFTWNKTNL